MANILGQAIRQIRKQKEIDQDSLGLSIGCTREAISLYESGKREVPTEKIHGIARHLGVEELDLLQIKINEQISRTIEEFKRSR